MELARAWREYDRRVGGCESCDEAGIDDGVGSLREEEVGSIQGGMIGTFRYLKENFED